MPAPKLCIPAIAIALIVMLAACSRSESDRLADVRRFIGTSDNASATIELRNILQDNPTSGEARFLFGKALLASGDALGAEIELRRALEARYSEDEVVPLLAEVQVTLRRFDVLLGEFAHKRLATPTALAELRTQVAAAHLAQGALDQSLAALTEADQLSPGKPATLQLRARLELARGQPAAALAIVDDLLGRDPNNALGWALKGDVLARSGPAAAGAATDAFRKALGLKPDLVAAHAGLIEALLGARNLDAAQEQWQLLKKAQPADAQTLYYEALIAIDRGDIARAREAAQKLVRGAPNDPRLQLIAGKAEMESGAFGQAEAHFVKALAIAPGSHPPSQMLAELYLRGGQARRALEALEPLLKADPENTVALNLAARAQMQAGNPAAAEPLFRRATKGRPDHLGNQIGLALSQAQAQARKGKGAGLVELAALARGDATGNADLALIDAHLQRREFDAALEAVERLATKLPRQPLPELARARIAQAQGQRPQVRAAWEAALAKQPGFLPALSALAEMDIADGQPDAARERFRAALQRDPGNAAIGVALADITGRTGGRKEDVVELLQAAIRSRPTDPDIRVKLVDYAVASGDHRLALTAAREAAAALPNSVDVQDRLGVAQLANGELQQAAAVFERLAKSQPDSAASQLRLVDARMAMRQFDLARGHARRAIELAPEAALPYRVGVLAALGGGAVEEAMAIARVAQKQARLGFVGLQLEVEVELAQRHFDAAIRVARKAFAASPGTESARLLHQALVAANRHAEAEQHVQRWLESHPDDLAFAIHVGVTSLNRNDLEQARARFDAVLQRQPNNLEALNNAAYVLALQKRPGAVALAEKAVKLAPNRPPLMDTLAMSYAAEGRLGQAVELQSRVVAIAPDQPVFRLNLARLQVQAGDTAAARESLDQLGKIQQPYPGKDEADRLRAQLVAVGGQTRPGGAQATPGAPAQPGPSFVTRRAVRNAVQQAAIGGAVLVAAVVPLILLVAALQPPTYRVERSITVAAPRKPVFDRLQDFRHWEQWATTLKPFDPSLTRRFTGTAAGLGAVCNWANAQRTAEGFLEVMHAVPADTLVVEAVVTKPVEQRQLFNVSLASDPDGATRVHWVAEGPASYAQRLRHVLRGVGRNVGRQVDASLARLKALAEAGAAGGVPTAAGGDVAAASRPG